MKAFLFGLGIGATVGLLWGPREGTRTRADIRKSVSDARKRFRESRQVESEDSEPIPESEAVAEVLNTAPRSELMSVDGIGKGTAKRIIQNRPYETGEEVLQEEILPEEILERVKEQLVDKNRDVA